MVEEDRPIVFADDRRLAGQQDEEQDPKRVDVDAHVDRLALDLLGREIPGRPDDVRLGDLVLFFDELGQPEVEQLDVAGLAVALAQHDVGRLDVAQHRLACVDVADAGEHLRGDGDERLERQLTDAVEVAPQRLAIEELHDDVGRRAVVAVREHLDHVGVVELGHALGLTVEARDGVGIFGPVRCEHLDDYLAVILFGVGGEVDQANAAPPDELLDHIPTTNGLVDEWVVTQRVLQRLGRHRRVAVERAPRRARSGGRYLNASQGGTGAPSRVWA